MTEKLSERLEMLVREHRETMSADVMRSWAHDAIVEMAEAAALARRVEGAPVAIFASHDVDAPPVGCEWDPLIASINGQRVALVPVEGGA